MVSFLMSDILNQNWPNLTQLKDILTTSDCQWDLKSLITLFALYKRYSAINLFVLAPYNTQSTLAQAMLSSAITYTCASITDAHTFMTYLEKQAPNQSETGFSIERPDPQVPLWHLIMQGAKCLIDLRHKYYPFNLFALHENVSITDFTLPAHTPIASIGLKAITSYFTRAPIDETEASNIIDYLDEHSLTEQIYEKGNHAFFEYISTHSYAAHQFYISRSLLSSPTPNIKRRWLSIYSTIIRDDDFYYPTIMYWKSFLASHGLKDEFNKCLYYMPSTSLNIIYVTGPDSIANYESILGPATTSSILAKKDLTLIALPCCPYARAVRKDCLNECAAVTSCTTLADLIDLASHIGRNKVIMHLANNHSPADTIYAQLQSQLFVEFMLAH